VIGFESTAHTADRMRRIRPRSATLRLLEAAGIERTDAHGRSVDIHALRHTTATRLARSVAPLAITQRVLGHSDPKLTARVYTHLGGGIGTPSG